MSSLLADLRAVGRYATRRRGVSLLVIAMLAIGIGAATAVFTVMDAVLLRELPYRSPSHWLSYSEY